MEQNRKPRDKCTYLWTPYKWDPRSRSEGLALPPAAPRVPGRTAELSVLGCRSCAWGHACLRLGGSQAGRNHLPPEHSSGGGKPSASRRPWVTGALPPELPGGWFERTLLCWFHFPALECFQCNRVNATGVCETGGSICQTQGSQQCFLRRIYESRWCLTGLRGELCWRLGVDSGCSRKGAQGIV